MDLRIQKTFENIETSFLSMRKKHDLNTIKISALCEKAKINKSTFYRYYLGIFDLSDKLENKLLSDIIDNLTSIDNALTDIKTFIYEIYSLIQKNEERVYTLFDDRINVFAEKIEQKLLSYYLKNNPSLTNKITLSFLIGGATHVLINSRQIKDEEITVLVSLIEKLSR